MRRTVILLQKVVVTSAQSVWHNTHHSFLMMVDQPENEVPGNSIGEEDAQPQAVHEAKEDDKRLPTLTTERPSPTSHPVVGGATADAAAAGIKSFQPKPAAPSAAPSPPSKTPDRAHVTVGGIRRKSSLSR